MMCGCCPVWLVWLRRAYAAHRRDAKCSCGFGGGKGFEAMLLMLRLLWGGIIIPPLSLVVPALSLITSLGTTITGGKRYLKAELKDFPALFTFSQTFYIEEKNSM